MMVSALKSGYFKRFCHSSSASSRSFLPWLPPGTPSAAGVTYPWRGSHPWRPELLRPTSRTLPPAWSGRAPSLRHWMASREVGGLATGLEPRHGGLAPCLRPRRRPQSPPPLGGQHAIRGLEDLVGMRYTSSSERRWWRIEMREAQTIRLPRRPTFLLAPDDRREALPYFLLSHISTTSLNIWTE